MDVSLATSIKITRNTGSDRTTWEHVFSRVGLPWSDDLCVASSQAAEANPLPPVRPQGSYRVPLAFVACVAVLTLVSIALLRPRVELADRASWKEQFFQASEGGEQAYTRADFATAEQLTERAVLIARKHEHAPSLANALRLAGQVQSGRGDYASAKERFEESLKIREAMLQTDNLPPLYEAIGEMELKLGNLDSAEAAFTASRNGFIRKENLGGIAMAYRGLGSVAHFRGSYSEASRLFDLSLQAARRANEHAMIADVTARRALVLRDQLRLSEALQSLHLCSAYWAAAGHSRWIAKTQVDLATVEIAAGHFESAKPRLTASLVAYRKIGDAAGVATARELLELTEREL